MLTGARQHWLELRVPPPVVAALCALASWGAAEALPAAAYAVPARGALATLLTASGIALALAAVRAFRRAGTTIHPLRPDQTCALVETGVYRLSRNPMYLGLALVLLGWTVWLGHGSGLVAITLYVGFITRFQVVPEERVLEARFGDHWAAYRRQVRRWL